MDAVAPGRGADVDDRISDPGGLGMEDALGVRQAHGHGVDQDVAVVSGVEVAFAAHGRDADAVAVAADPGDHARDQMPGAGVLGASEAERVEIGDGARAHGEHVAQNPADAGRRALVGLDERRVIVAFHLEDRGLAVADVDHAGVLARPLDHPRRLRRQGLQPLLRGLVGAMLRPHDREDAELGQVRRAPHDPENPAVLVGRKPVGGDDLGGDFVPVHAFTPNPE